jgi:hypothetical protein
VKSQWKIQGRVKFLCLEWHIETKGFRLILLSWIFKSGETVALNLSFHQRNHFTRLINQGCQRLYPVRKKKDTWSLKNSLGVHLRSRFSNNFSHISTVVLFILEQHRTDTWSSWKKLLGNSFITLLSVISYQLSVISYQLSVLPHIFSNLGITRLSEGISGFPGNL